MFFSFCFQFLKETNHQKSLNIQIVSSVLKSIMGNNRSSFTDSFTKFLSNSKIKCLNLDQFRMFVDFSCIIKPDFSNYDTNDAWPTVYDDYVDFMKNNEMMDYSLEF